MDKVSWLCVRYIILEFHCYISYVYCYISYVLGQQALCKVHESSSFKTTHVLKLELKRWSFEKAALEFTSPDAACKAHDEKKLF